MTIDSVKLNLEFLESLGVELFIFFLEKDSILSASFIFLEIDLAENVNKLVFEFGTGYQPSNTVTCVRDNR